MRRIRTVAVFPTLFTLGNLICGFFAIVVASRIAAPQSDEIPRGAVIELRESPFAFVTQLDKQNTVHNAMLCSFLIFLAMLFDALDGHVARLAKASSDFGAQLDSLCDLVTFGVAPAILLVKMCPRFAYLHSHGIWAIAAVYAACTAIRLARFNVETGQDDDHMHFSGLPSPAAAASLAAFAITFYALRNEAAGFRYREQFDIALQLVLPFFALLVAMLMVSRIPYPHIVNQLFRGQRSLGHVVGLLFGTVLVVLWWSFSIPLLCATFVLAPPLIFAARLIRERRTADEPLF